MLHLPPPGTLNRVLHTDEFVTRTDAFYYASTERQIIIGNPYFRVLGDRSKVIAEKVSPHQFRVFRLLLPDPNKLALVDSTVYDAKTERLVWLLRGFDVGRGGALGVGATGHPLFDKLKDAENPNNSYNKTVDSDARQNVCIDPKSMQMILVGCSPAVGQHWDAATPCVDDQEDKSSCPPLELKNTVIEDGDMMDLGFGTMNNKALNQSHSAVPLDIVDSITKYPDMLKMAADRYGNTCWFCVVREQMFARHLWVRNGALGDAIPNDVQHKDDSLYLSGSGDRAQLSSHAYMCTPSGSMVSSDTQIFNRPFWLQRAQGKNNGACWNNEVFVSIADNTRGTNLSISVKKDGVIEDQYKYKGSDFKQYVRHCEIYDVSLVLQLGRVSLTAEAVAHLNAMDPDILRGWNIGFETSAPVAGEENYRYLSSLATKCPEVPDEDRPKPRYHGMSFWTIDLSKSLTRDLDNYPLGRKFLYQAGLTGLGSTAGRKRPAPTALSRSKGKRKRVKQ
ncbi:L1 [Tursiops truncatus papillomavirus 7]|uniref:Major capsid protein L1 n=1 Tax=Tursiops truncatus papillomavirus 7 TaxID=1144383 RepID=H6UYQ8_9PAPI|nr:L1 [Tursiops truncatus papillomavirus 7]